MRMIDYYNYAAIVLETILIAAALVIRTNARKKNTFCTGSSQGADTSGSAGFSSAAAFPNGGAGTQTPPAASLEDRFFAGRGYDAAVILLFLLGAFLRLWNLTGLPDGLQQDEASIGYEAYCLARFGIDRNGYHWPVYPITWGSGGGSPLMIYLNVLTTKLLGPGIFSIRIVPAVLGTLTLLLFFLLLKRAFGKRTALIGLFVLSVTPWHIILSRWSLDSNTMPFWQLLFLSALVCAVSAKKRQTGCYLLAAVFAGICMYSYGSANVVIPLTLLFACAALLSTKRLSLRQLVLCFFAFLAVCLPLAIFYAVNFLGLPEISASWISFPKFTASHFESVFVSFDRTLPSALWNNFKDLLRMLTVGTRTEVSWNAMPGYWTLYCFTFPVTFAGVLFGRTKKEDAPAARAANDVFLAALAAALVFSLFLQQDINRAVLLFLPLVYWLVMGLVFLWKSFCPTVFPAVLSLLLILGGFCSFAKDYYGGTYNEVCATDFMPGYGDAMILADKMANEKGEDAVVYSTYDLVASPFMLTLYYTQYDPYEFQRSVVYKDPEAEFRVASSFGHFVFGLPVPEGSEDLSCLMTDDYAQDIFVLTKKEAESFPDADYDKAVFKDRFVVISRK